MWSLFPRQTFTRADLSHNTCAHSKINMVHLVRILILMCLFSVIFPAPEHTTKSLHQLLEDQWPNAWQVTFILLINPRMCIIHWAFHTVLFTQCYVHMSVTDFYFRFQHSHPLRCFSKTVLTVYCSGLLIQRCEFSRGFKNTFSN